MRREERRDPEMLLVRAIGAIARVVSRDPSGGRGGARAERRGGITPPGLRRAPPGRPVASGRRARARAGQRFFFRNDVILSSTFDSSQSIPYVSVPPERLIPYLPLPAYLQETFLILSCTGFFAPAVFAQR